MLPTYSEKEICLELRHIQTAHIAPHLHASLEILLLLSGTYTIGCGIDLFPMQKGDLCIIFPGLIHHYHFFDANQGKALLLLAAPSYLGAFTEVLTTKRPVTPVIAKEDVHPDIRYALSQLEALTEEAAAPADMAEQALLHSFVQILLARTLPKLSLYDRTDEKNSAPAYQAVTYIAAHFQEAITLQSMARDLGISPYQLSRVFSGTFHQNFNRYLNDVRLSFVTSMLRDTEQPVTEIAYNAGFQSQATFNRVFRSHYHCTPRDFRRAAKVSIPSDPL